MAELFEYGKMYNGLEISTNTFGNYGIFSVEEKSLILSLSIAEMVELRDSINDALAELKESITDGAVRAKE